LKKGCVARSTGIAVKKNRRGREGSRLLAWD
jgi:hypothetical protein